VEEKMRYERQLAFTSGGAGMKKQVLRTVKITGRGQGTYQPPAEAKPGKSGLPKSRGEIPPAPRDK